MPTDFTAPPRDLSYPLDLSAAYGAIVDDENPCGLPEFPEDSDEKITVLFRLSLNQFVALASAIDAGSDIAYGKDGYKVWWIWIASIMCASFCEEMAICTSDPESPFVSALADALRNNPLLAAAIAEALPAAGAAVPGRSLTPGQAATDMLPVEVRDEEGECIDNALWGACLYLVQFGNRAIIDFFEVLESASNTLEASAIVANSIPAAGSFASSAAEFADQLLENFSEGYAAAYTEEYESELACAIFCLARDSCSLTPEMLNSLIQQRMPDAPLFTTFAAVMNYMGVTFPVGASIADAMFAIFFTALQFGQQFGEVIGWRPLTDLMGLGADQLASDNWEVLCECNVPAYEVRQYAEYTGGSPVSTQVFEYGEQVFTPVVDSFGDYSLRLEFTPSVNVTYVSHTGAQTLGAKVALETWADRIVQPGSVYEFWNFPGFGNNTTLPYIGLDNPPDGDLSRLFLRSTSPFTITLDIQPDI